MANTDESQPLLKSADLYTEPRSKEETKRQKNMMFLQHEEDVHVMEYDTRDLGTWSTLVAYSGTIWANRLLWQAASRIMLLSLFVALLMLVQPDPESIVKANFMQLANALKIFVTFLLGFFMSTSINRWSETVDGFLVLFNASRNINMQFHALGVNAAHRHLCKRFGILSATFLHFEIRMRAISDKEEAKQLVKDVFDDLVDENMMTEAERLTLEKVGDRAGLCWVWVASLMGRLAQDGDIPPMPSPTYGRLICLAQAAQEGIRKVRVSVAVQSPFVYVHILAFLVHVNNIFCAVAFGCVLGTVIASILSRHHVEIGRRIWGDVFHDDRVSRGSTADDVLTTCMSFLTCIVFPILLQAFLQIGLLLAQPFDGVSAIPTMHMIKQLKRDLDDQDVVASEPSQWEQPCFKKPI